MPRLQGSLGLLLVALTACSSSGQKLGDGGTTGQDGAPTADAGASDSAGSSLLDASPPDSGAVADASGPDAMEVDSGPTCTPNQACATNPGAPCRSGLTACPAGSPVTCIDGPSAPDGTLCSNGVCAGGACLGPTEIAADLNLTTDTITSSRACAEAPAFSVRKIELRGATLTSTPAGDCLVHGDEVLVINLQGSRTATANVGNWEVLPVDHVVGARVDFAESKAHAYGAQAGSDLGIGVGPLDQKVALVRVPKYGALTIASGAKVTANPWDGFTGGVVALRAGSIAVDGAITAATLGFRDGRWSRDDSNCADSLTTESGESIAGPSSASTMRDSGGAGGIGAATGISFNGNTPVCSTSGHATAGVPGTNGNGRTIGPPGGIYGAGDGSRLTMGSGAAGNVTCDVIPMGPIYVDLMGHAAGIVLLLTGDVRVGASGQIVAAPLNRGRDTAASGGYVLIRGHDLDIGDQRITALGGIALGGSPSTSNVMNPAGDGYVVFETTGTVTGTAAPAANVIHR
jgi:hypothetical protein